MIFSLFDNAGKIPHGLRLHPDRIHMIYPLGCNLVIENLQTRQQEFLLGHNNNISCVTISNNGKYIASGQVTYMGFKVRTEQRETLIDFVKSINYPKDT